MKARNKSFSSNENRLDGRESDLNEDDKQRVSVVNFRANSDMDYCSHTGCGKRFANNCKAPYLVVRRARGYIPTYLHKYLRSYLHTYIHVHTYTHIHAYVQT